jgi:GNAT superfamily N-acetyltransferase
MPPTPPVQPVSDAAPQLVPPQQWPDGLARLSIAGWLAGRHDGVEALQHTRELGLELDMMWARYDASHKPVHVALIVPQAGRTGLVFTSPLAEETDVPLMAALLDVACRHANPARVAIAQALTPPDDAWTLRALAEARFTTLATLRYMQCRPPRHPPALDAPGHVQFDGYRPELAPLFERTLLASYDQTRDCPDLRGRRRIADVLEGHRAVGCFDPAMWTLLRVGDEPAGVLLLNPVPAADCLELVYLGLAVNFRRQGLASLLMRRAIHQCLDGGHRLITLAADDRNTDALRLYERFGFKTTIRRVAMIRSIDPATAPTPG